MPGPFESRLSAAALRTAAAGARTRAVEEAAVTAVSRPRPTGPATVFVNLGDAEKQADIARDGVQVPLLRIDPSALAKAVPIVPRLQPRVVGQSIPAGTRVPVGTAVEVVLASPFDLPAKVVPDVHVALADTPLEEVFRTFVRDRDDVRAVLARNTSADTLSEGDRAVLRSALAARNIAVDDAQAGAGVRQAFTALQAAQTFNA